MTKQQINFASYHDWYISNDGESVLVMDIVLNEDGLLTEETKRFTNFEALLVWAGY